MARQKDTRGELLDAAVAVLITKGETAVRVDDLARTVNVAKPSIYHFFGSREGLVVAALAEMYRRSLSYDREPLLEAARAASTREEFVDMFRAVVTSYFTDDGTQRRALRMEVLGAAVSRPDLQAAIAELNREQTEFLAQFFAVGTERGFVSLRRDHRTTALWAIGVVLGRHMAEIDPTADLGAWDSLTVETFVHLLFGDADPD